MCRVPGRPPRRVLDDAGVVRVVAETVDTGLSIGEGALRIASVRSRSETTLAPNDPEPVTRSQLIIEGATLAGQAVTIDATGVHLAGQTVPAPVGRGAGVRERPPRSGRHQRHGDTDRQARQRRRPGDHQPAGHPRAEQPQGDARHALRRRVERDRGRRGRPTRPRYDRPGRARRWSRRRSTRTGTVAGFAGSGRGRYNPVHRRDRHRRSPNGTPRVASRVARRPRGRLPHCLWPAPIGRHRCARPPASGRLPRRSYPTWPRPERCSRSSPSAASGLLFATRLHRFRAMKVRA